MNFEFNFFPTVTSMATCLKAQRKSTVEYTVKLEEKILSSWKDEKQYYQKGHSLIRCLRAYKEDMIHLERFIILSSSFSYLNLL